MVEDSQSASLRPTVWLVSLLDKATWDLETIDVLNRVNSQHRSSTGGSRLGCMFSE